MTLIFVWTAWKTEVVFSAAFLLSLFFCLKLGTAVVPLFLAPSVTQLFKNLR